MANFNLVLPEEKMKEMVQQAIERIKSDNDLVKVVRCKDCRHCWCCGWSHSEGTLYGCQKFDTEIKLDDFCSYGERRDSDAAD